MNKKALRMYGIGEAPRASRLNPAIMFWVLPGLAFVGFATVSSVLAGRIDSADALPSCSAPYSCSPASGPTGDKENSTPI
jgi:hypothetical protein